MSLKRDVYRAIEDVVGVEYISEEPADQHAYAFHWGKEVHPAITSFAPLADAIVLPASTEEVQAIVKTCNRYKVRFKPLSTGWGHWNSPGEKGAIQIDLRRMNRIIEINEKNMYAVVEPYVISAQLQAELMKRGMNFNIIGAGSNTTALAPAKLAGYGFSGQSTGVDSRNILAFEWVLPNGDIVRTGSLSSGAGWFYSEGPGPSLRGVARGIYSAYGGTGIYTKAALKTYHWPGPPVPQIEGRQTSYSIKITPDMLMKLWYTYFDSADNMGEALYKLAEADVAIVCNRFGNTNLATALVESNEEFVEMFKRLQKEIKVGGFIVIIAANSQKEFAYGEKVLHQILAETKGKILPLIEEPRYQGLLMWHVIRASSAPREAFRPTGTFSTTFGGMETIDFAVNQMKLGTELKRTKHIPKGKILDSVEDFNWGNAYEGGHLCHLEEMILCHGTPEGLEGGRAFVEEAAMAALDPELKFHTGNPPIGTMGDLLHNLFGPANSNYHLWLRKFKEAFDPNGVAEGNFYVTADNEYKDEAFFKLGK